MAILAQKPPCVLLRSMNIESKRDVRTTSRHWRSGELAGQLRPRVDSDFLEDSREVFLYRGRRDPKGRRNVTIPIPAENQLGDLDLTPRETIAVSEGGNVRADLADADRDVTVPSTQLHEVHDERLVVMAGQGYRRASLRRPIAGLGQMVEEHDQ